MDNRALKFATRNGKRIYVNKNEMSKSEWVEAAGGWQGKSLKEKLAMETAWSAGKDPTDWKKG